MTERKPWKTYFLDIAEQVATRATCERKKVGAVLVRDNQILVTGYNGSMPGQEHCTDAGCIVVENHCIRTVHAEQNALAKAAKRGVSIEGATCYSTINPCWLCYKLLTNAGVSEFWYREGSPHGSWPRQVEKLFDTSTEMLPEVLQELLTR